MDRAGQWAILWEKTFSVGILGGLAGAKEHRDGEEHPGGGIKQRRHPGGGIKQRRG